jgi:cysteine desulfurase/selenocysteine lyase
MNLASYRKLFPVTENDIYLNHAAISPLSVNVRTAVDFFVQKRSVGPVDVYPGVIREKELLKENLARLINGEPGQIAIMGSTSEGLNWLANSIKWEAGDRILLTDYEFPSNVYPFLNLKRYGVEVDFVPNRDGKIIIEDIEKMITPRTRLISVSFVEFLNGFRNDLVAIGKICRANDIIFSVDSIQGLGAIPLDVKAANIDFVANGGHKWLMGVMGCGFMYVAPRIHALLTPVFAGWLGVKDSWNFLDYRLDLLDDAGRYEIATQNFIGMTALRASTDILVEVQPERTMNHLFRLGEQLIGGMTGLGFRFTGSDSLAERSGIYSFIMTDGRDISGLHEYLSKRRIFVSLRNGSLRVAPHFYNIPSEIDELVRACNEYLAK